MQVNGGLTGSGPARDRRASRLRHLTRLQDKRSGAGQRRGPSTAAGPVERHAPRTWVGAAGGARGCGYFPPAAVGSSVCWFRTSDRHRSPRAGSGGRARLTGRGVLAVDLDGWAEWAGAAPEPPPAARPTPTRPPELELGELPELIVTWAARLTGTEDALLWLVEPERQRLLVECGTGRFAASTGRSLH